jgi:glycosyltransferase 2 family protein
MSARLDGSGRLAIMLHFARSLWFRVGVTTLLLVVVGTRLDWSRIARRLADGRPLDFGLAVLVVLLALAVGACRWRALLAGAEVPLGVGRLARIYAVSTFSGSFLPTTAGADVARALLVARRGRLLTRTAVSVVVDRLGGFAGMLALAWLALAWQPATVPVSARALLGWTTAAAVGGALGAGIVALRAPRLLRRFVPGRLLESAREARDVLHTYTRAPRLLIAWLLSSLAYQALIAFQLVLLARAIDVELSFATAAVALALVTIVTLVPISIGGFGVREASYVVLLGGVSIAASDATLISVLSVATLLVASLPGAYLIVRGDVGAVPEAVPA